MIDSRDSHFNPTFAFRLAWRQLWYDKVRFMTAISGVLFACILVFIQIGFKEALFQSATLLQSKLSGQIYVIDERSEALWRLVSFPLQELYKANSQPEVDDITWLYAGQAAWKNPVTGNSRTALILGINPHSNVYMFDGLSDKMDLLKMRNTVLFDSLSRKEFGPVEDMLREKGEFSVELRGENTDVVGTFRMGITFSADGNLIVSDSTFFKLFPEKSQDGVDIGIITLKPGSDVLAVQKKLKSILPDDLKIMTKEEYIADEKKYWNDIMPIGYIFNFGVVMGLFVGLIIVYQVLFNDITNHLHEYATLKAMGYPNFYFIIVVISSSLILMAGGYLPGLLISTGLYSLIEKNIFIAMDMTPSKIVNTFGMITGMCFISGFLAVRKLRAASPVDVFQ